MNPVPLPYLQARRLRIVSRAFSLSSPKCRGQ